MTALVWSYWIDLAGKFLSDNFLQTERQVHYIKYLINVWLHYFFMSLLFTCLESLSPKIEISRGDLHNPQDSTWFEHIPQTMWPFPQLWIGDAGTSRQIVHSNICSNWSCGWDWVDDKYKELLEGWRNWNRILLINFVYIDMYDKQELSKAHLLYFSVLLILRLLFLSKFYPWQQLGHNIEGWSCLKCFNQFLNQTN